MKFWFISYSLIWVFGKCHSFNILSFYKLKVTEMKTLKIILIHLFFKTEPSAQSHKTLANDPGSFCTVCLLLLHWLCSVLVIYGATVQVFTVEMSYYLNSLKTTFESSLQGEAHVQLQHFLLVNQMHPIPLDLSPERKKEKQSYVTFWNGINNTHRPLNNERWFASK